MDKPSIAETHPEIAAQLVDVDPTTITFASNRRVKWRCDLGHEWLTQPLIRTRSKWGARGCPICLGRRALAGFNDLATLHPELAEQLISPDPTTVTVGSGKRGIWRCKAGHEFEATIAARRCSNSCKFCSGREAIAGETDLATLHPDLADQLVDADATKIRPGSGKKQTWVCEFGHKWKAVVSSRTSQGHGCPFCAGQRVVAGVNDLASSRPHLIEQLVDPDFDPSEVAAHTSRKAQWRCSEGHVWTAAIFARTNGQGCPSCSISGFDATAVSANVYLLHDSINGLTKAGISGTHVDRVKHFGQRGMNAVSVVTTSGAHAREVERDLLAELKAHGPLIGKAEFQKLYDRMGGWTETVDDPDGVAMRAALAVIERAKETPSLFA